MPELNWGVTGGLGAAFLGSLSKRRETLVCSFLGCYAGGTETCTDSGLSDT